MKILVCGGAGYVGAHVARELHLRNHEVTVLDNLSTGHRQAVRWGRFVQADVMVPPSLDSVLRGGAFEAVVHLCALSIVSGSTADPYGYYLNNVQGTLNLLRSMRDHGVGKLVFSSTAAIYGQPLSDVISEDHPKNPLSPYGASKLMVERILADAATAYGLSSVSLRYFNAAGAAYLDGIGESHQPETHLIPNVLRSLLAGSPLQVFGNQYATPDGTCVRDYVHVRDLASAHALALDYLGNHTGAHAFNLGSGAGFSVMDVIRTAERVTGKRASVILREPRAGDPAQLVASSLLAQTELGWHAPLHDLDEIVLGAWRWHQDPAY
ncbi:UDP-glucose 4-epimerase GalE [Pseudoxanthomonas jiangsuensis]|uniref:UDP-glucose 4-epimerase GalE n=1 Tax=Pseudoxanthomonas jiangsuensis TaxID=619688 RepID=UPI0013907BD7|nr:UDP-glucose 4-epimerase GalE [Pseudoxanthomonas jiangsuensis]KAF1697891.1 UDP-glucose 4-epimerase GalE [Pseudoxanthomonas jiangsuensis]